MTRRCSLFAAGVLALLAAGAARAQPPAGPQPAVTAAVKPPIVRRTTPGQATGTAPQNAGQAAEQRAAMGDLSGGRQIPALVLRILADPRIDPTTAYILWQAARRPLDEWTIGELTQIMQITPTLVETGMNPAALRVLYEFLGLDPNDLFNTQLGQDWQGRSTAFNPGLNQAAISAAECQVPMEDMTVGTFKACQQATQ